MTPFQKNISDLLKHHGAIARLSKATGIDKATIGRWKRGGEISDENLDKICEHYGKTREWMTTGKESTSPAPIVKEAPKVNLETQVDIPIRGKVWASPFRISWERYIGLLRGRPGEQDCFALQVEGDSMMPLYVPGDYVICRPRAVTLHPYGDGDEGSSYVPVDVMAPYHNRDVILTHEGHTMLKRIQIERRGGLRYDLYMVSVNKEYQRVKVRFGDEWLMQAVVIRTEKPEIPE